MDDETLEWIAKDTKIDPISGIPFTAVVFMIHYGLDLKQFLLQLSDRLVEKYPLKVYDVGRSSLYLCGSTAHGFYLNTNSFLHVKDFDVVSICKKYTIRKHCHYDNETVAIMHPKSSTEPELQDERNKCEPLNVSNDTCTDDMFYLNVEKWQDTYPGYVMLRKCRKYQGIAQTMSDAYVSSSRVMESRLQFWRDAESQILQQVHSGAGTSMLVPVFSIADIAGPAINVHLTYSKYAATTKFNTDIVFAFKYPGWPEEAEDWKTRQRKSGWPSSDLLNSVINAGCEIVPTGHIFSARKDFEWKISFSHGEMQLSRSFNRIQRELVHVMKALVQFQPSYHVLNIMYGLMEHVDPNDWIKQNFAGLYFLFTDTYIKCIESKELPHYFIKTRNLIEMYRYPTVEVHGSVIPTDEYIDLVLLELNEMRRDPLKKILSQSRNIALTEDLHSLVFGPFVEHFPTENVEIKNIYVETLIKLAIAHVNQENIEIAYTFAQDALKLYGKIVKEDEIIPTFVDLHLTVAVTSHLHGDTETCLKSLIALQPYMKDDCKLYIGNGAGDYIKFYYMLYGRMLAIKHKTYRYVDLPEDTEEKATPHADGSKIDHEHLQQSQRSDIDVSTVMRKPYTSKVESHVSMNVDFEKGDRTKHESIPIDMASKMYTLASESLNQDDTDATILTDMINFSFLMGNIDDADKYITELLATSMPDFFLKRKQEMKGKCSSNFADTSKLNSITDNTKESLKTEMKKPKLYDDKNNHENEEVLYERQGKCEMEEHEAESNKAESMNRDEDLYGAFDGDLVKYFLLGKRYEAIGMHDKAIEIRDRVRQRLIKEYMKEKHGIEESELFGKFETHVNSNGKNQHEMKVLIPEHWNHVFKYYMKNIVFGFGDILVLDDILQQVVKKTRKIIKIPLSVALMHFLIQRYKIKGVLSSAKMMLEQLASWEELTEVGHLIAAFHFLYFDETKRADDAFQKASKVTSLEVTVEEELLNRIDHLIDIVSKFEIKNSVIDNIFA